MSSSDLQDMTLNALRDAFRKDVQGLFANYIEDVLQSAGDKRKQERARERFDEGLEISRDAYATLTAIAIRKG